MVLRSWFAGEWKWNCGLNMLRFFFEWALSRLKMQSYWTFTGVKLCQEAYDN
jgi:hypothetical protein